MIIKANRNILIAVLGIAAVLSASTIHAASFLNTGVMIQASPYDHKLSSIGLWNTPFLFNKTSSPNRTPEQLFTIAKSFRYVSDSMGDHWQTPMETENKRSGDCEDKAIWIYAQLKQVGLAELRLVIGKYRSIDTTHHVWVTYQNASGEVMVLDPAVQNKIWKISDFPSGYYQPLYSFDGISRYRHPLHSSLTMRQVSHD